MKKKQISKIVLKTSEGILSSLTDLLLWNVFYFWKVGPFGQPGNLRKAEFLAYRQLDKFNYETIKRAIYRARAKGWIKQDLTPTKEGKTRLKTLFPFYFGKRKWNGNWYLVSYDVPEEKNRLRNILRENLKRLGFGLVHASLWISPFNFLGEVEKIVKEYNLSGFVILAISDKVGREESKILADRIWGVNKINEVYRNLLEKTQTTPPKDLIFQYLAILRKDPQLPSELLPEDWLGHQAYQTFKKHLPFSDFSD